jgi:hypothetical protein
MVLVAREAAHVNVALHGNKPDAIVVAATVGGVTDGDTLVSAR